MLFTTTSNFQGMVISKYLGLVSGHCILGANVVKDAFANIRDVVGGRATSYEKELARARDFASEEMAKAAQSLGANAVVGIDLDFEVLGRENGMLMVVASGTAVVVN